jgi:putative Ca2+/H+ antiporter (TMEM165/GDT1 family)
MDWKLFTATFGTIFLAELGDKTQFAAIAASGQSKSTIEILLAVILALALAGTLGVLAGKVLSQVLNPEYLRWISAVMFIGMGLWILFRGGSEG